MTVITGNLIITISDTADYSTLTSVGGSLYVLDGATVTAPALTSVGWTDVR